MLFVKPTDQGNAGPAHEQSVGSEYKPNKVKQYHKRRTWLKQQGILNAWEIKVSTWEHNIEIVCASLTLNAWDLKLWKKEIYISKR